MQPDSDRDRVLLEQLTEAEQTGGVVETTLRTDDRVLARVTDGIYREPSSALRELIANAYDADARNVTVRTDPPRFGRITISDDGLGMSKEALVSLINHIGGSAKRTQAGVKLGLAQKGDPALSPGGRRLIGKIGIGLFSVSQLTRTFRIVTKQSGNSRRLVAQVHLHSYSEENAQKDRGTKEVVTGKVIIESVVAEDKASQGTEIILLDLHPAARDLLRSRQVWERLSGVDGEENEFSGQAFEPPIFHIGRVDPEEEMTLSHTAELPWEPKDGALERFKKLRSAVRDAANTTSGNLQLSRILDTYLHTLWTLSLSLPLDYLDGTHPFDIDNSYGIRVFQISNKDRDQSKEVELIGKKTIRDELGLTTPRTIGFNVIVDDVELRRPIALRDLPGTSEEEPERRKPLIFVGKFSAPLSSHPVEISGGRELAFEAYFLWAPKVIPRDHAGVMIRIANASGMPFDESFIGYKVAEMTRLKQITAEVFVHQGFEAALNIDRESFNFGHPHAKILTSWVYRALRQLANRHKAIVSADLREAREEQRSSATDAVKKVVLTATRSHEHDLPKVLFVAPDQLSSTRKTGAVAYDRSLLGGGDARGAHRPQEALFEEKMRAVAQILEEFGALEGLSLKRRQKLIAAIAQIFRVET